MPDDMKPSAAALDREARIRAEIRRAREGAAMLALVAAVIASALIAAPLLNWLWP